MKDLIAVVVEARQRAAELREQWEVLRGEWQAAHRELLEAAGAAQARALMAEEALRNAALATYNATGDKHPAPGVEVKMGTKMVYDPAEALAWAVEHGMCLALAKGAFEKVAKASPIPCVQVVETSFVALATELQEVKP